ncbi:MAG TPA: TerC family protein [Chloroflexota bacterium]
MDLFSPETVTALMGVIVVNLVLSGDNAVVIGMAAHRLHGRQRTLAIVFGGIAAVVLRIAFTIAAAYLMKIPALTFIGGVLLIWIAYKLLMEEVGDAGEHKAAESMLQALWIITVADVVMSLDNILAIAALARESMAILAIGLAMSMAIVLFAGGIVAVLMERFPWINYIGSIAIAYVAGEMIMKDEFVRNLAPGLMKVISEAQASIELGVLPLIVAIAVPVIATWRNSRGKAEATDSVAAEPAPVPAEH